MTTQTPERPRCPVCKIADVRYRASDNSYGCRGCGHRWPKS